uniref:Hypothetical chloroplast RF34 n=1 Tax=Gastroclonium compressum TaxID=1852973 RepID=A0A173FZZ0_GASCM|nr:hypothetical chloroplast RF34 [Coeloseira compressa]ANH09589.1 hypothetical chloroplast RF34 [Coeloseira compressa]
MFLMCICVNCLHVSRCKTYYLIGRQHGHCLNHCAMNFIPVSSLILVNITKSQDLNVFEWDLKECLSFTEKPGNWILK